jgi:hypothetical protein
MATGMPKVWEHSVMSVDDGQKALAAIERSPPDVRARSLFKLGGCISNRSA